LRGGSNSAGAKDENNAPELFHSQITFDRCKKVSGDPFYPLLQGALRYYLEERGDQLCKSGDLMTL